MIEARTSETLKYKFVALTMLSALIPSIFIGGIIGVPLELEPTQMRATTLLVFLFVAPLIYKFHFSALTDNRATYQNSVLKINYGKKGVLEIDSLEILEAYDNLPPQYAGVRDKLHGFYHYQAMKAWKSMYLLVLSGNKVVLLTFPHIKDHQWFISKVLQNVGIELKDGSRMGEKLSERASEIVLPNTVQSI
jgi:hypothetical protein